MVDKRTDIWAFGCVLFEMPVGPFPNAGDAQWLVSTGGGRQPLWARSGRELFYVAPDGSLMAVPAVPRGTSWGAGTPAKLVDGRYFTGGGLGGDPGRHYDVSLADTRFLMMKDIADPATPLQIVVVQNWFEELKQRVPLR